MALAGQKADGYLARPAESIPSLKGILERLSAAAVEAGRDPASHRASRLPPDARRRHPPRGAQPRQARAVRHLHDVDPGRRLPQAGRLRGRAARPHRRGLARGGVPRGRQAHPRRPARRVHAVRHPRGRGRRRPALPRRGWPGPAAAPAGRPGDGAGRGDPRGGHPVRHGPGHGRAPAASPRRWPATASWGRSAGPGERSARPGRSCAPSPSRLRSCRSPPAARWPPPTAGSAGRSSCWRWPAACCCTPAPTSSTRSTTSARASTRSPRRGPATPCSRAASASVVRSAGVPGLCHRHRDRRGPGRGARVAHRGPRPDRPGERLLLYRPAVRLQVPRPRRAARLRHVRAAHARGRLFRRDRDVEPDRARPLGAGRACW